MIKTNNYSFLKYLNHYDLANKYNLKSIYLVPQISKISLKVISEESSTLKFKEKYNALLFYYLYNFQCSKVVINLLKKLKKLTGKVIVSVDVSNKKQFDFLISLVFFLNNKVLKPTFSSALCNFNLASGKPHYQYLYFTFSTFVSNFIRTSKSKISLDNIYFYELPISFDFAVKSPVTLVPFDSLKKKSLYTHLFKNIFMFWSLKF